MIEVNEGRIYQIGREFRAPRDLVYQAWTDPDRLVRWWGGDGCAITTHELELRPGGLWRHAKRQPDGAEHICQMRFREFAAPERIVYEQLNDDESVCFTVTVSFAPSATGTRLTMRFEFPSAEAREAVVNHPLFAGLGQSLEQLNDELSGWSLEAPADEPTIRVTRRFAATPEEVFDAWTSREQVMAWWGCEMSSLIACEIDLRAGGRFDYLLRVGDEHEAPFSGEFREIERPSRLVYLDLEPGQEEPALTTVTLTADGVGTLLTMVSVYPNLASRDQMLAWGGDWGLRTSLRKLDRYLSPAPAPAAA